MQRRQMMAGGLAAAAWAASPARAAQHCLQSGICEVGVPSLDLATPLQMCEAWCWAASIETIFLLHGHPVDQRVIVEKLYGALVCATANDDQILAAINGRWIDRYGGRFTARADVLADSARNFRRSDFYTAIFDDLQRGWPLLVGAAHHVTVVTAMGYLPNPFQPAYVTVRDPWPGNPNRRKLSPREISGTSFLSRVVID